MQSRTEFKSKVNFLYDDALYDALSESERAIVPAEAAGLGLKRFENSREPHFAWICSDLCSFLQVAEHCQAGQQASVRIYFHHRFLFPHFFQFDLPKREEGACMVLCAVTLVHVLCIRM